MPLDKLLLVSAWEESGTLFDVREQAALAWAETVTHISATHVPDDAYRAASPYSRTRNWQA